MNTLIDRLTILLAAMEPFDEIAIRHDGRKVILITKSTLREEYPVGVLK